MVSAEARRRVQAVDALRHGWPIAIEGLGLLAVETADPDACSGLSGAWPVGFIRAGG